MRGAGRRVLKGGRRRWQVRLASLCDRGARYGSACSASVPAVMGVDSGGRRVIESPLSPSRRQVRAGGGGARVTPVLSQRSSKGTCVWGERYAQRQAARVRRRTLRNSAAR